MNRLTLYVLGTGGGRFVMTTQRRRTAGIQFVHDGTRVHIDPGPGAIVFSNWAGLNPQNLDAIIVTHCHLDHYGDAEAFIEAMSRATTKRRGIIAAPMSVLHGDGDCGPSISAYHQRLVERVEELRPGVSFDVNDLKFAATKAHHSDPDTVGLRIEAPDLGAIGYTSDTDYFPGIGDGYRDARLLILCTMRPRGRPLELHLSIDDALEAMKRARPHCAVLTHFGMLMLKAGPDSEASYLEGESGIPTVAARDGMRIDLSDRIEISGLSRKDPTRVIDG